MILFLVISVRLVLSKDMRDNTDFSSENERTNVNASPTIRIDPSKYSIAD
ncbi:hypothetical protein [Methanosarcina horonobensis]|nr:hypothetical protein [Methanosarcina horonobensis]